MILSYENYLTKITKNVLYFWQKSLPKKYSLLYSLGPNCFTKNCQFFICENCLAKKCSLFYFVAKIVLLKKIINMCVLYFGKKLPCYKWIFILFSDGNSLQKLQKKKMCPLSLVKIALLKNDSLFYFYLKLP